jgi:type IV pilus assembly protein PilA
VNVNLKQRMKKEEDEGFTLIELMVVVLILGILMAIAIPTFLSLTSNAKTNAAESDLTTASQDEATLYTQNGTYGTTALLNITQPATATSPASGVSNIDAGINWFPTSTTVGLTVPAAGTKGVLVIEGTATPAGSEVILGTASSNTNNYWIDDNAGTLTYAVTTSAVTGATGHVPASPDFAGHSSWASLSAVTSIPGS